MFDEKGELLFLLVAFFSPSPSFSLSLLLESSPSQLLMNIPLCNDDVRNRYGYGDQLGSMRLVCVCVCVKQYVMSVTNTCTWLYMYVHE